MGHAAGTGDVAARQRCASWHSRQRIRGSNGVGQSGQHQVGLLGGTCATAGRVGEAGSRPGCACTQLALLHLLEPRYAV